MTASQFGALSIVAASIGLVGMWECERGSNAAIVPVALSAVSLMILLAIRCGLI